MMKWDLPYIKPDLHYKELSDLYGNLNNSYYWQ